MGPLILFDTSSLAYASQHATPLTVGGRQVHAIFHTLKTVHGVMAKWREARPVALVDGRAKFRFDIYADYKGNRGDDPKKIAIKEAVKDQLPDLLTMLRGLGIETAKAEDFEADDLAALYTDRFAQAKREVVLVSGDKDWIQLVQPGVLWCDHRHDRAVTHGVFHELTGYRTPADFVEGKALTGDTSDNIPGVGGIGEKGAPELLATYGSVAQLVAAHQANPKLKLPAAWRRLATNENGAHDRFERNVRLMDLRKAPPVTGIERGQRLPLEVFIQKAEELAFRSILADVGTWLLPFSHLIEQRRAA